MSKLKTSRLLGTRAYLCGPIDRARDDGRVWRDQISPSLLQYGVVVFDPLNKPIDEAPEDPESRAERRLWKANGEYDKFSRFMKQIVAIDLRLVNTCDFIIALIDLDIFSCGTLEEIFRANDQKKPVLIFCVQGKAAVPDWLFGKLPHELFFDSADAVLEYLDKVAYDETPPPHFNRWLHFQTDKIYPDEIVDQIGRATLGVN